MNTKALAAVLLLLLSLPWLVFLVAHDSVVGMYLEKPHVLVEGDSDVYDSLWQFWWVSHALGNGEDPRVYMGKSLAWHNIGWPDQFVSFLTGTGYNFMLWFGAILSAFAGYLLARSWGVGKNGSLVAGFIVVWMPVHLIRIYQHYTIASIGYVLFALYFMKQFANLKRKFYLLPIAFFSALAVLESLYHGLLIAAGWAITFFLSGRDGFRRPLYAGLAAAAGCIIASLWFFLASGAIDHSPGKDWRDAVYWGAEPESYLLPSFLGNPTVPAYMPNPFEGVVSPGLSVALLAIIYAFRKKSWRSLVVVLGMVILSVGPLLKTGGVPTPVPLPYMVLVKIPWLSAARAPSRLAILPGIMAAIAAGALIEKRKPVVAWLLTALIALEITPIELKTIEATVPQFYYRNTSSNLTMELPATDRIRRYSLFEVADSAPRIIKYLARGGEAQMENIPGSLCWGSETAPVEADIFSTGAERVIYNRWMFSDSLRNHYDTLYCGLFPDSGKTDSVWVWTKQ